jgi:FtsZ-binding cell division protein ZapB
MSSQHLSKKCGLCKERTTPSHTYITCEKRFLPEYQATFRSLQDKASLRKRPRADSSTSSAAIQTEVQIRPFSFTSDSFSPQVLPEIPSLASFSSTPVLSSSSSSSDQSAIQPNPYAAIQWLQAEIMELKKANIELAEGQKKLREDQEKLAEAQKNLSYEQRELKMAIIQFCYMLPASNYITQSEISNISYPEFEPFQNWGLVELCIFLSDNQTKKKKQVEQLWTTMERILYSKREELVELKHRSRLQVIAGSELFQLFQSIETESRKDLITDKHKKFRAQMCADFLIAFRRHIMPEEHGSIIDSLQALVEETKILEQRPAPTVSYQNIVLAFCKLLHFESHSPYPLSQKSLGVWVYHFLCVATELGGLQKKSFIHFDQWRFFMELFHMITRFAASNQCLPPYPRLTRYFSSS